MVRRVVETRLAFSLIILPCIGEDGSFARSGTIPPRELTTVCLKEGHGSVSVAFTSPDERCTAKGWRGYTHLPPRCRPSSHLSIPKASSPYSLEHPAPFVRPVSSTFASLSGLVPPKRNENQPSPHEWALIDRQTGIAFHESLPEHPGRALRNELHWYQQGCWGCCSRDRNLHPGM